jgi:hypothetical protein
VKPVVVLLCTLLVAVEWFGEPRAQRRRDLYQAGNPTFVEDMVFGSDDEEDDGALFHATSVCVDGAGAVYVLDYKMFCIQKYGSDGEHLLTFSRHGEGPGEIARAYRMTMTPEEHLVVFDADNRRFTVFDRQGDYVDSQGFQAWVTGLHALSDGSLLLLYSVMRDNWMDKGSFYLVSRLAPDLDTETVIDSAYIKESEIIQSTESSMTSVGRPFVGRFHIAVSSSGNLVIAHGDEYRLRVLSPNLEPVREITREDRRVKVSGDDKEEYFEDFERSEENLQILVRQKVDFPNYKPYITDLFVDDYGFILVEVPERAGADEHMRYDVFTPDGEFVNRIEMKALRRPAVFRGGYLYMAKVSDDELPVVARYRLRAAKTPATP